MQQVARQIEAEHRNMARVLKALEANADRAGSEPKADDIDRLFDICQYVRVFPDAIHHPKEDQYVFDPLRTHAPEHHELLDKVQHQHQACSDHTERLYHTVQSYAERNADASTLKEVVQDYLRFQFEHMRLEEREVLPLAEKLLDPQALAGAGRAFASHGDPLFGENLEAGFKALHDRITDR